MTHFLTIKDNQYNNIKNENNCSDNLNNYPIHQFTFGVTDNLDNDFNNITNAWTQLYNNSSSNKFMIVFFSLSSHKYDSFFLFFLKNLS